MSPPITPPFAAGNCCCCCILFPFPPETLGIIIVLPVGGAPGGVVAEKDEGAPAAGMGIGPLIMFPLRYNEWMLASPPPSSAGLGARTEDDE